MKLIIDIGNTNSVYAILNDNNYIYKRRLSSNENIENIINEISNYNIHFIAIASVVPKQTLIHIDAFQKYFNIVPFLVNHKNANVKLNVDNINEVGADRICNVKAALNIIDSNCIILDFGTATTYDVINQKKQFIGGAIAPGIKVSALNLINKAAMLNETNLIFPEKYIGNVISLCIERRGVQKSLRYVGGQIELIYEMPMNEIVLDFFDKLKSSSKGYASLDYDFLRFEPSDITKIDILLNGEKVDALNFMVHKSKADYKAREIVKSLREVIPRQMYDVAIQGAIGSKILARETVKAYRKDVTAKLYGGDVTRKKKLLEKQKKGKKKMRQIGKVEVPQEAFLSVLRVTK